MWKLLNAYYFVVGLSFVCISRFIFCWMLTKIIMKRFISGKGHMWKCRNILNKILKCLYNFCHTMATQVQQSNGSPDLFKGYNIKQIDSKNINKIKALKFDYIFGFGISVCCFWLHLNCFDFWVSNNGFGIWFLMTTVIKLLLHHNTGNIEG